MHTSMHIRKGCPHSLQGLCCPASWDPDCEHCPGCSLCTRAFVLFGGCSAVVSSKLQTPCGMTEIRAWPKGNMDANSSRPWCLRAKTFIFQMSVSLFSDSLCKQHQEDRVNTHTNTHTLFIFCL